MSLNLTTLSGACAQGDLAVGLTSATGITAPNLTTGAGTTFLYVESEMMQVTAISGTYASVTRGVMGTQAVAHNNSSPVIAGLVTDFPQFNPTVTSLAVGPGRSVGVSAPVAAATAITPTGGVFHVTGTTTFSTINLPLNFVEGSIKIIFDGVASWGTTGNIAAVGTPTTAGSFVEFLYDGEKALWYPSRLA